MKIEEIVKAIEPNYFARGNASDIPGLIELLHSTVEKRGLKILLLDSVCRLEEAKRAPVPEDIKILIDNDICRGEACKICVSEFGCPAIGWNREQGRPVILDTLCVQCGACIDVCPHDAIKEEDT